jgi:hypothetical protein
MFTSILGTIVEVQQISTKDRLERKKYMGVWSFESELTARMMSRFPSMVTMYIVSNSPKRMGCNTGSSESPRRKYSITSVLFSDSMLFSSLLEDSNISDNESGT